MYTKLLSRKESMMYKVLIIGAGKIAAGYDMPESDAILTHAHAYKNDPAFKLLGFYDTCYQKGEEAARLWGCQAYSELLPVLKTADIVCCCVPDQFHGTILKQIAECPPRLVVAEKPLAATRKEAEQIAELYAGKIPLVINYSRRFQNEFQELKKKIGTYGRFLKGTGYYGKGFLHNGSHMTDLLRFFFGKMEDFRVLPSRIQDYGEDFSKDAMFKIQDGWFYMLAVDSRIVTVFEMELLFEKARIRILEGGDVIEKYEIRQSGTYEGYHQYVLTKRIRVDESGAMTGLLENIKNFLEGGKKLNCTLLDGLEAMELC